MKTNKMGSKKKRMHFGGQKKAKRSIHVKGEWKAVEIDPSVFADEDMGGLMCFEELTSYRLVDSEKAAAQAEKLQKKKEKKAEKRKAKKRKASEVEEAGEKEDVKVGEGEDTPEPAKKKPKKKNKKNKKLAAEESAPVDEAASDLPQEAVAASDEGGQDEAATEETLKDKTESSEPETQSKPAKKNKKKQKKQKQQAEGDNVPEGQPNQETPSALQAEEEEKPTQDKVTKPAKKQIKNWTNAALSGSADKNTDVSAWRDLFVPAPVLKALSSLGFGSPTPIQALALPSAIRDRMDILGAAETGEMNYPLPSSFLFFSFF